MPPIGQNAGGVRQPGGASPAPTTPIPRLWVLARRPAIACVLALGLVFQLWAASRIEGYGLADAVEHVDLADEFYCGEGIDPLSLRSFGLPALLLPWLATVDVLGLHDPRLPYIGGQVLCALFAALATLLAARTALRLGGPSAAVAAAFAMAVSPIVARYAFTPLPGIAAMFFVALAVDILVGPARRARAAGAGAALGLAIAMAYQTLPLALAFGALGMVRPLWRRAWSVVTFGTALAAPLIAQALFDLWSLGRFGTTLASYVAANAGSLGARALYHLGFEETAAALYQRLWDVSPSASLPSLLPPTWYFEQLFNQGMALAVALALVLGTVIAARRRDARTLCLFAVALGMVLLLSSKGAKSFRLWLPLMPALAVVAGVGAGALWDGVGHARWTPFLRVTRFGLGVLAFAALIQGAQMLRAQNLTKFGAYWRAVDVLTAQLPSGGRYAADYHWCVRFRGCPDRELVKLPHGLDRWSRIDSVERHELLDALVNLDGFIAHLQSLAQDPKLLEATNRHFQVIEIFDERPQMEDLEPLHVFVRRSGAGDEHTLHRLFAADSPQASDVAAYVANIQFPAELTFQETVADGRTLGLEFLGFDVEAPFEGTPQAWVTLHWRAVTDLDGTDLVLWDRWVDSEGTGWDNDHRGARGAHPTGLWRAGEIVRESFATRWQLESGFGGPGPMRALELAIAIADPALSHAKVHHWRVRSREIRDPRRREAMRTVPLHWRGDGTLIVGAVPWQLPR